MKTTFNKGRFTVAETQIMNKMLEKNPGERWVISHLAEKFNRPYDSIYNYYYRVSNPRVGNPDYKNFKDEKTKKIRNVVKDESIMIKSKIENTESKLLNVLYNNFLNLAIEIDNLLKNNNQNNDIEKERII